MINKAPSSPAVIRSPNARRPPTPDRLRAARRRWRALGARFCCCRRTPGHFPAGDRHRARRLWHVDAGTCDQRASLYGRFTGHCHRQLRRLEYLQHSADRRILRPLGASHRDLTCVEARWRCRHRGLCRIHGIGVLLAIKPPHGLRLRRTSDHLPGLCHSPGASCAGSRSQRCVRDIRSLRRTPAKRRVCSRAPPQMECPLRPCAAVLDGPCRFGHDHLWWPHSGRLSHLPLHR